MPKQKILLLFAFYQEGLRPEKIKFSACKFIKNWTFSKMFLKFFPIFKKYPFWWTLVSRSSCLYLTRSYVGQGSYFTKDTPNSIAFLISPYDYDITVNRRKKWQLCSCFYISQKQPPAAIFLKEVFNNFPLFFFWWNFETFILAEMFCLLKVANSFGWRRNFHLTKLHELYLVIKKKK